MSEGELGHVFSFACASIGDSYLLCRCAQNGKACLVPILLADVVSVGSRVVCYHDGLIIAVVLMYSVVCGKADMLVLVNLFYHIDYMRDIVSTVPLHPLTAMPLFSNIELLEYLQERILP